MKAHDTFMLTWIIWRCPVCIGLTFELHILMSIGIGEKEKRQRKENGKENGIATGEDSSTNSSDSKKKSSKTTALLKTKLDDDEDGSDSDIVPSKGYVEK